MSDGASRAGRRCTRIQSPRWRPQQSACPGGVVCLFWWPSHELLRKLPSSWCRRARSRSVELILVSCPALMLVPWQMKEPSSLPGLAQPGDEPPTLFVGQKGVSGPIWPVERRDSRVWPVRVKKQLRMAAARWLCSGHPSERSAWLDGRVRVLLTPARCADLPPPAREAGQHWRRRRAKSTQNARLAGSDGAEARWAAGGRCGGFAQSCGRCRSFDRGRPDLCSRHPQGSCGRFERVLPAIRRIFFRPFPPCHAPFLLERDLMITDSWFMY
jgi:hypothetical protein